MAKYKVGQKIFLKSESSPELNGEYTVSSCGIDEAGITVYGIGLVGKSGWDSWAESALNEVIDPFDVANPF